MSKEDAQQALTRHRKFLLQLLGVNLVYTATKITDGKDTGKHAVVVAVTKKHTLGNLFALGLEPIPITLEVEGIAVLTDVVEGGPFTVSPDYKSLATPIDDPKDHQKKFRPTVPGGVSAIVCGSSACTTTCWVWSNRRPDGSAGPMLLHNWHCSYLNACPEMLTLQPSPYDGGFPTDAISKVTAGNIDNPTTDSAVDVPLDDGYATMDIYGIGSYLGYTVPNVGDLLRKSGRTTGLTDGQCVAIDGSANVQYPDKVRVKSDLIVTTDMLAGGDSSSPLRIRGLAQLAGQGFAGGGGTSLFIKIPNILSDPAIAPYQLDFNHQFGGTPIGMYLTVSPSTIVNDGSTQIRFTVQNVTVGDEIVVGVVQPDGTPITELYNDTAPSTTITGTGSYTGPYTGAAYVQAGDLTTHDTSNQVQVTVTNPQPTPSPCPVGNGAAKVLSILPILLGRQGRFYYLNPK